MANNNGGSYYIKLIKFEKQGLGVGGGAVEKSAITHSAGKGGDLAL